MNGCKSGFGLISEHGLLNLGTTCIGGRVKAVVMTRVAVKKVLAYAVRDKFLKYWEKDAYNGRKILKKVISEIIEDEAFKKFDLISHLPSMYYYYE